MTIAEYQVERIRNLVEFLELDSDDEVKLGWLADRIRHALGDVEC